MKAFIAWERAWRTYFFKPSPTVSLRKIHSFITIYLSRHFYRIFETVSKPVSLWITCCFFRTLVFRWLPHLSNNRSELLYSYTLSHLETTTFDLLMSLTIKKLAISFIIMTNSFLKPSSNLRRFSLIVHSPLLNINLCTPRSTHFTSVAVLLGFVFWS